MYDKAIERYIQALLDIATALEQHHEARTAFEAIFLTRIVHDGFLQAVTEQDENRILYENRPGEEFLLWHGAVPGVKMHWNSIGWIFPFSTSEEVENSYEIITRSKLALKSWAGLRQFWLSCRMRFQEAPLSIPTNIVKVRVVGEECRQAMRVLKKHPPNLRYVAKILQERSHPTSYLKHQIHLKLVIGEQLEPYAQLPR
ncbi:hypothetical protein CSA56_05720 [candidate division KSB3 bacterium]|uniref:Uncharacterized protein n=1 Tax=candidate division KSB3 bacterium TaxID=2044937 RepID=A0A2G6KHD7_9BACT|nr:MAG: hypothetical protein CSA56_05720 [candidate division KSB3 bacterium]